MLGLNMAADEDNMAEITKWRRSKMYDQMQAEIESGGSVRGTVPSKNLNRVEDLNF